MTTTDILALAEELGFSHAGPLNTGALRFLPEVRDMCAADRCHNYGKCWTCPPDVREINELIEKAKGYQWAVVYQSIGQLEDSYDFEGMMAAGETHEKNSREFIQRTKGIWNGDFLHLSAGGCRHCARCAILDEEPCRFPEEALSSLEAYGVAVSQLAPKVGMKYINGANTVTYFGMCLFQDANE